MGDHLSFDLESRRAGGLRQARPDRDRSVRRALSRARHGRAAYEAGLKERIVISEFPSVENANNAYNSPAYQDALKALGNGAVRDIRIVEAVE